MTTKKTRTTATDLLPLVWDVLKKAKKGRGQYAFLTAYQILAELPREVTAKLIEEYGPAAGGVGNRFGAAGPVAAAGVMLERQKNKDVEITFLDTRGMRDILLLEAGFLTVFLAPWRLWPSRQHERLGE